MNKTLTIKMHLVVIAKKIIKLFYLYNITPFIFSRVICKTHYTILNKNNKRWNTNIIQ